MCLCLKFILSEACFRFRKHLKQAKIKIKKKTRQSNAFTCYLTDSPLIMLVKTLKLHKYVGAKENIMSCCLNT